MTRTRVFQGLIVAHFVAGAVYLGWRLTAGMGSSWGLSLLFLGAEAYGFATALSFGLSHFASPPVAGLDPQARDPQARSEPSPSGSAGSALPNLALAELPSITVVISRRWDSVQTTAQTAKAALQIRYPWHRLFVTILDAEADETMRQVATQIPCEYWVCQQPDPLQDVLKKSSGEFILWLQPGHLPDPGVLEAMVPYFYDFPHKAPILNRTGFVQATLRTVGRPFPDHPLQQLIPLGGFAAGIAPLLGTGTVIRRQALEQIDNPDVRRPLRLGSQLHRLGWRSEVCGGAEVQGGLLPLRNRRVALLSVLDGIIFGLLGGRPQISRVQSLGYLHLLLWTLSGWPHLIFFTMPLWFLLTGATPVPAFDQVWLAWILPYLGSGVAVWIAAYHSFGLKRAWQAQRYSGAQFFQSIVATIQAIREVSPHPDQPSQLTLGSQAAMILVSLGVVILRLGQFRELDELGIPPLGLGIALVWIIYNLVILSVRPLDLSNR